SEAGRIYFLDRGNEDCVDAFGLEQPEIALFVARVALEVLAGAELGRVDEDGDDDMIVVRVRSTDEGEVALVQIAHGRDEADVTGHAASLGLHLGDEIGRASCRERVQSSVGG